MKPDPNKDEIVTASDGHMLTPWFGFVAVNGLMLTEETTKIIYCSQTPWPRSNCSLLFRTVEAVEPTFKKALFKAWTTCGMAVSWRSLRQPEVACHPLQVEVVINPQIAAKAAAAVHSQARPVGCPFRRDSIRSSGVTMIFRSYQSIDWSIIISYYLILFHIISYYLILSQYLSI